MKTKSIGVLLAGLLLLALCYATAAREVVPTLLQLEPAHTKGTVSVEQALHQRRSLRDPLPAALSQTEIGQLCWAAQGVTDPATGHRTAPSAMARYPLELYVITSPALDLMAGIYHYEPDKHALRLLVPGDQRAAFREQAARQEWIAKAPAIFVIAGAVERMSGMGERGRDFMLVEAGLAAQNLFLQAEALGMGSTYVGGFDPVKARTALGLPEDQEVLAVLPVGRRQ